MIRWLLSVSLLCAVVAPGAAVARPREPITGAYQVLVPVSGACRAGIPGSEDLHPVTFPARGHVEIELAGRGFDMDLELTTPGGGPVAKSHKPGPVEKVIYKVRKAGSYTIRVCNYIAGPVGDVTFEFVAQ